VRKQAAKVTEESVAIFTKKGELFRGHVKTCHMFDDNRTHEAEALGESKQIYSTVMRRLNHTAEYLIRQVDVLLQKSTTNCIAKADIVLNDGTVLAEELPATFLLDLENKLKAWVKLYETAPTNTATVEWVEDDNMPEGVLRAKEPVKTHRTEKALKVISLAAATPQHKEQVQAINQDVVIGQYITETFSGMLKQSERSAILGRVYELLEAVKKARMRANTALVVKGLIGKEIFDFIHNGI